MSTKSRLIFENSIKHVLVILSALLLWGWIWGVIGRANEASLGPIGTVMGLLVIASLSSYFAFSFTAVGKAFHWRLAGYGTTFFLFLAFILSVEVILALAIRWVPELQPLWWGIVLSLYCGAVAFDYLDLMRIGLDVASLDFFERTVTTREEELDFLLKEIRRGRSLADANAIIARALLLVGRRTGNMKLKTAASALFDKPEADQHEVDQKVVEALTPFSERDAELAEWLTRLRIGVTQQEADTLIADSVERVAQK